jgi:hypothetical protein
MNERCIGCHEKLLTHREPSREAAPLCLDCHKREHRGRDAFYHVPDASCVRCHKQPPARADGAPSRLRGVADLPDHPQFAALRDGPRSDRVRANFPHATHCREGLPARDGIRVTLNCVSCHEPDQAGRHYFSVSYERHCSQCHVLSVRLPAAFNGAEWEALARRFRETPAPHRSPAEILDALTARLVAEAGRHPGLSRAWTTRGQVAGAPESEPATWPRRAAREVIEPLLSGPAGCLTCHLPAGERDGLLAFQRTGIRDRWLPASPFNHAPHTSRVDCGRCHPAVGSVDAREVLIPGVANCRTCHDALKDPPLAARDTCVTCHAYHGQGKRYAEDQALWRSLLPHP